ncbi:MAG: hypothetical protein KDK70_12710 [Myxococcales bacterium]|nr:hypothetical protein [Myxococcales bacterium]
MDEPKHPLRQGNLLKGMTSDLRKGACWGLSVQWLLECVSGSPSVAGLAMTVGTTAYEAILRHAEHANEFLAGTDDDASIGNCTLILSGMKLDAVRRDIVDTKGHLTTAVSIIAAMDERIFHGLIVLSCPRGRHAMAVANYRNTWALFDPNFGTWTYAGCAMGAPTSFSRLLVDVFEYYAVTEVKLFTIHRLQ